MPDLKKAEREWGLWTSLRHLREAQAQLEQAARQIKTTRDAEFAAPETFSSSPVALFENRLLMAGGILEDMDPLTPEEFNLLHQMVTDLGVQLLEKETCN